MFLSSQKIAEVIFDLNQRQIGGIVIVIGILLAGFMVALKSQNDAEVEHYIAEQGTCIDETGTCIHAKNATQYVFGWVLSLSLIILGIYLVFFDRTQATLAQQNIRVARALREAKRDEEKKDAFTAFLAGFKEEEQLVLKAVLEQDGIKQSTLRFRTGMSKATLSQLLASLEERDFVTRKPSGKTKEVYLRKKF